MVEYFLVSESFQLFYGFVVFLFVYDFKKGLEIKNWIENLK